MITEIIKEANLTGAKDERLPYPLGNAALSKLDSATEEQKKECKKLIDRIIGIDYLIWTTSSSTLKSRIGPARPNKTLIIELALFCS